MKGFAERFTEASQKFSQTMRHFLPKCTSSSAASIHPDLRRLSRQLSQRQPLLSPDLLRIGRIEAVLARHNATPSQSTKDPGPSSPWNRRLRSPPDQPGRKRRGLRLTTVGPPRKQSKMCLLLPRSALGAEESVLLVPHGPTLAPGRPTTVIADKIKHIHFKKESKNLLLPTISVLPVCSQSLELFQLLGTCAEAW